MAFLTLLTLVFYAMWWNRYVGLTLEGWFAYYGREIFHGAIPYRDFYLFAPPLHALVAGLLDATFSGNLAAIRVFGGLERLGAAIIALLWLRGLFGDRAAFIAMVPTVICFSADVSDILFYYQQDAAITAMLGALALCAAVEHSGIKAAPLGLAGGLAFGLTLATRQTVGLLVIFAALIIIVYLGAFRSLAWRTAAWLTGALLTGLVLAAAPMVAWLTAHGALGAFFDDVFVNGPTSKGSLAAILLRPLTGQFNRASLIVLAFAVAGLVAAALLSRPPRADTENRSSTLTPVPWTAGAFALAMLGGLTLALAPPRVFGHYDTALRMVRLIAVDFGFLGCVAIFAWMAVRGVAAPPAARERRLIVAFGVTAAATYAAALSGATYEPMILPAFPLVAGFVLAAPARDFDIRLPLAPSLKAVGVLALALAVTATTTASKLRATYNFGGFGQGPAWSPRGPLALPALQGLRLSRRTAADLEAIVSTVDHNSTRDDRIVATTNIPLIYLLSNRRAATFAPLAFIDVAPDTVVRADAARIAAHPPKVIVIQDDTEQILRKAETDFRGGIRSGQRDLWETLQRLKPSYQVAYIARFDGPPTLPIEVWVRRR